LRRFVIPALALLGALALGTAVMAQSASGTADFEIEVTNPYVAWDGATLNPATVEVKAEPGMARLYKAEHTFTVVSLTPFDITVSAAWRDDSKIKVNVDNLAIGGVAEPNNGFDIQISARGNPNDYSTAHSVPAAGSKTVSESRNTLHETLTSDAVQFGARVWLVLVDGQDAIGDGSALDPRRNTSGWDSRGQDNVRFDALPAGQYDVDVTVTVTETP